MNRRFPPIESDEPLDPEIKEDATSNSGYFGDIFDGGIIYLLIIIAIVFLLFDWY